MSQTPPTPVDTAPTLPDRADRTTFPTRMYNMFAYLVGAFTTGIEALATNAYNNAVDCYNNAVVAAASALTASNAAAASIANANATAWVSGASYEQGKVVWSLVNFLPYRRSVAGVGTTDPSADLSNWVVQVAGDPQWTTKTNADSPFTAVVGEAYDIDTSGGAVTMNLPATMAANDTILVKDLMGTFATNNLFIGQNGHKIESLAEDGTCDLNHEVRTITYKNTTIGVTVR